MKKLELNSTTIRATRCFGGGYARVLPTLKGPIFLLDRVLYYLDDNEQKTFSIGHDLTHINDRFDIKVLCASWEFPLAWIEYALQSICLLKKITPFNLKSHGLLVQYYLFFVCQ